MPAIIFVSGYAAIGFLITMLCFFLSGLIGAVIFPRLKRRGIRVQRRNRGSGTLNWIGWIIAIGVSLNFGAVGIGLLPSWIYFLGIILMLTGIAFRQWAIAALGRFFSNVLAVQAEQKVIETGPYRTLPLDKTPVLYRCPHASGRPGISITVLDRVSYRRCNLWRGIRLQDACRRKNTC